MKIAAYIITALLGSCAPAQCQPSAEDQGLMPKPAPAGVIPSGWYDPATGEPTIKPSPTVLISGDCTTLTVDVIGWPEGWVGEIEPVGQPPARMAMNTKSVFPWSSWYTPSVRVFVWDGTVIPSPDPQVFTQDIDVTAC